MNKIYSFIAVTNYHQQQGELCYEDLRKVTPTATKRIHRSRNKLESFSHAKQCKYCIVCYNTASFVVTKFGLYVLALKDFENSQEPNYIISSFDNVACRPLLL